MSIAFNSMKSKRRKVKSEINHKEFKPSKNGFKNYIKALCDDMFPFPSYNDYQDEILYEILESYLIYGYENVVVEGPTGIGKSAINVTVPHVLAELANKQKEIREHFKINFHELDDGSAFYTTPQKSLRNQLANDGDLEDYVTMLKSRRDYICGESGEPSNKCPVKFSSAESCLEAGNCTYWSAKSRSMKSHVAAITFAMQVVDNYLPEKTQEGDKLSFGNRDLIIVDEGHGLEEQSASLFAGFMLSPWVFPSNIYGDTGEKLDWNDDKMEDILGPLSELKQRANNFVSNNSEDESVQEEVEQCQKVLQKLRYAFKTQKEGHGWAVNITPVSKKHSRGKTKGIEMKPILVDDFLSNYIWSRGKLKLITSATIPFRNNVKKWAERIGLEGRVKFISKSTPFPKPHRKIHLNTIVGPMDSKNEEDNWAGAMQEIERISSQHEGEKGLIHCVSYSRAEKVSESLEEDNVMIQDRDIDQTIAINKWQNSDKDILVSPSMTEGVDLDGDKCRWQVLLKVPFAYIGDNRVSYLLNELGEWNWYMENAAIDIIQSIGRAVRGPEAHEAASYYVIDEKFVDALQRTSPPNYIIDAITENPPEHWSDSQAAPWR